MSSITNSLKSITLLSGHLDKSGQDKNTVNIVENYTRILPVWHAYGLTSHAPDNSRVLIAQPMGDESEAGVILTKVKDAPPTLKKADEVQTGTITLSTHTHATPQGPTSVPL